MKKKAAAVLLLLSLCGCEPKKTAYTEASLTAGFDTVFSYTEYAESREVYLPHFESTVRMFSSLSSLFDIYQEEEGTGGLKQINDNAGIRPVKADPAVLELLAGAQMMYELTGGAFDITCGNVMRLWHTYREAGIQAEAEGKTPAVPSEAEIRDALACRGWAHVHIDPAAQTVYIDDPDISLDAGGIAKGYAAEAIRRTVSSAGIDTALINAGRNICTLGTKPSGKLWVIAVASPDGSGEELMTIQVPGSGSVVTSGDYERYYTGPDGTRYHHILDLSSGMPADRFHSVTVITENSMYADALSTALFTVSMTEGQKILVEYEKSTGMHADAVWITDAGRQESDLPSFRHGSWDILVTEELLPHVTFLK